MKKYFLKSGPIISIGFMFGTIIGVNIGNIKLGVALGLLAGVAISSSLILLGYFKQKKND